jgi:hypothetical protein
MTQLPPVSSLPAVPPSPPPAPAPLPRTSGLALASLILGTLAICGAWLCCGMGFPTSALAIVLGHIAVLKINRSGGRLDGRGMAIAGLLMGYIGLILQILAVIIWIICSVHHHQWQMRHQLPQQPPSIAY